MRNNSAAFLSLITWLFSATIALGAEGTSAVVRLDPALDAIVPANAHIEKLADGFKFVEGPVWIHDGYLLFSDIPNNAIMKWTPNGEVKVFLSPSGYIPPASPGDRPPGSNGLTLDKQGQLIICQHQGRQVVLRERDGKLTVLADRFEGKRLNSPNDAVVKSDGSIYFTDPPYGLRKGNQDPEKELPFNGVFRWNDGTIQLIVKDLTAPNGIAFSPDEKVLYVAVSDPTHRVWMRYEVQPDGTVANGRIFFDATSSPEKGLPDGMKVDQKGNVYATGPGGVLIFSPRGKHLGTIRLPESPANCAWGDRDGKTLYVTASTGLYRIRLKIPGTRP